MKLTMKDLWEATIQTTPINPSEFTITVQIDSASRFVLTPWDVVDACKEYIIKYQKELMQDWRYFEINL